MTLGIVAAVAAAGLVAATVGALRPRSPFARVLFYLGAIVASWALIGLLVLLALLVAMDVAAP